MAIIVPNHRDSKISFSFESCETISSNDIEPIVILSLISIVTYSPAATDLSLDDKSSCAPEPPFVCVWLSLLLLFPQATTIAIGATNVVIEPNHSSVFSYTLLRNKLIFFYINKTINKKNVLRQFRFFS